MVQNKCICTAPDVLVQWCSRRIYIRLHYCTYRAKHREHRMNREAMNPKPGNLLNPRPEPLGLAARAPEPPGKCMADTIRLGVRLSGMQRTILDVLEGRERGRLFGSARALDTDELLEELGARGLVKADRRKLAMFTVRRAAMALYRRGLIAAKYVPCCEHPGRRTINWTAKEPTNPT